MDRKIKNKIIISISFFIAGVIISFFFSTILHNLLLEKNISSVSFPNIKDAIDSLKSSTKHLKLFLCFIGLNITLILIIFFSNEKAYKSDLIKITPDIYTPARAGQNQHGSSRWMTEKEKDTFLKSIILNPNDSKIKKLIDEGYEEFDKEGEEN